VVTCAVAFNKNSLLSTKKVYMMHHKKKCFFTIQTK